jgi:hypothetical protein
VACDGETRLVVVRFAFGAAFKPVSGIGYELIKIDSIHTFAS